MDLASDSTSICHPVVAHRRGRLLEGIHAARCILAKPEPGRALKARVLVASDSR